MALDLPRSLRADEDAAQVIRLELHLSVLDLGKALQHGRRALDVVGPETDVHFRKRGPPQVDDRLASLEGLEVTSGIAIGELAGLLLHESLDRFPVTCVGEAPESVADAIVVAASERYVHVAVRFGVLVVVDQAAVADLVIGMGPDPHVGEYVARPVVCRGLHRPELGLDAPALFVPDQIRDEVRAWKARHSHLP